MRKAGGETDETESITGCNLTGNRYDPRVPQFLGDRALGRICSRILIGSLHAEHHMVPRSWCGIYYRGNRISNHACVEKQQVSSRVNRYIPSEESPGRKTAATEEWLSFGVFRPPTVVWLSGTMCSSVRRARGPRKPRPVAV